MNVSCFLPESCLDLVVGDMAFTFPQIIHLSPHRGGKQYANNASTLSSQDGQNEINKMYSFDVGNCTPQSSSSGHMSSSDADIIPVKLRCGIRPHELHTIWRIHMQSFPIEYSRDYYRWLLGPSCLSVLALTTPEVFQAMQRSQNSEGGRSPQNDEVDGSLVSITQLSVKPLYLTNLHGTCDPKVQKVRAETNQMICELERAEGGKETGGTTDTAEPTDFKYDSVAEKRPLCDKAGSEENYTVVIGLAVGEIGYARHQNGRLFTNPTCYLCSLAIDPVFRGLGLGGTLLDCFIDYVTNMPLRASSFLHHDVSRIAKISTWTSYATEKLSNESYLQNGGNTSVKAGGGANFPEELDNVRVSIEGGDKKRRRIIEAILKYKDSWDLSWFGIRRILQKGAAQDVASDQVVSDSYTMDSELDTLFQEFVLSDGNCAIQDRVVQRGVREVWLHCIANDLFLMSFYTQRGFQLMRTLKRFYEVGSLYFDASFLVYSTELSLRGRPLMNGNFSDREKNGQNMDSRKLQVHYEGIQKVSPPLEGSRDDSMQNNSSILSEGTAGSPPLWLTPSVYKDVSQIELKSPEKCREEWKLLISLTEGSATVRAPESNVVHDFFFTCSTLLVVLTVSWMVYKIVV